MPKTNQDAAVQAPPAVPKQESKLKVIVNPEDTVGIPLQPAYISLAIKPEQFKADVGGTASS